LRNTIAYSILKYSHSKILGEELNVGILFAFPEYGIIEFHSPTNLQRLVKTYPDLDVKLIASYLDSFNSSAKKLSSVLPSYSLDLNKLIYEQFIIQDSSALQFSKFNFALFDGDFEITKAKYKQLFLGAYQVKKTENLHKLNDHSISMVCKNIILSIRPEISAYLKTDIVLLENKSVKLKTDFYWQNGTTNFVKGITFDLSKADEIIKKSLLIGNQLNYLSDKIINSNARVDLLLAKPSNEKLTSTYLEAIDILNNSSANISITSDDYFNYAEKVIDEIEIH
jgi:hypothetical protein